MSLHGIMPINIGDKTSIEALELMLQVMSGQEFLEYTFLQHHLNLPGKVEGVLTGGNLSMIYSLRGTPYDVDTERKVLFIEDLDEYLYHIDRMLQNFELSGFFDQVSAVLVGGMTDMNDNTIPYGKTAEEIIHEHVSKYNIPLFYNAPTGHFSNNMPMVCGANATIVEENDMVSLKIHI